MVVAALGREGRFAGAKSPRTDVPRCGACLAGGARMVSWRPSSVRRALRPRRGVWSVHRYRSTVRGGDGGSDPG